MKITPGLFFAAGFLFLTGITGHVHADRDEGFAEPQDIKQMMEMLKKSGVDPKTQKQIENMMGGMAKKEAKQQAAKLEKEQQTFEVATAGNGTAQIEVEGKQYELKVTKCELWGSPSGRFLIEARQAPNEGKGSLRMGKSDHGGGSLDFSNEQNSYYLEDERGKSDAKSPEILMQGKKLEWKGLIHTSNKGKEVSVAATIRLACGSEVADYAAPSRSKPKSEVNVLTLQLGEETHTFQTGVCSTTEYRSGNLIVEFDATATGVFRGRPAIILLSKSHAVKEYGGKYFQTLDLFLGELSAEQRSLASLEVKTQIQNIGQDIYAKELPAIMKKYQEMAKSAPPEKMVAVLEAQSKEMNQLTEKTEAMRYPAASGHGTITINGQEVHFRGPEMHTQDASRVTEFQNFSAEPEIWVTCGK